MSFAVALPLAVGWFEWFADLGFLVAAVAVVWLLKRRSASKSRRLSNPK